MAGDMTQIAWARISNCHQNEAIPTGKAAGSAFTNEDSATLALSELPALTPDLRFARIELSAPVPHIVQASGTLSTLETRPAMAGFLGLQLRGLHEAYLDDRDWFEADTSRYLLIRVTALSMERSSAAWKRQTNGCA